MPGEDNRIPRWSTQSGSWRLAPQHLCWKEGRCKFPPYLFAGIEGQITLKNQYKPWADMFDVVLCWLGKTHCQSYSNSKDISYETVSFNQQSQNQKTISSRHYSCIIHTLPLISHSVNQTYVQLFIHTHIFWRQILISLEKKVYYIQFSAVPTLSNTGIPYIIKISYVDKNQKR